MFNVNQTVSELRPTTKTWWFEVIPSYTCVQIMKLQPALVNLIFISSEYPYWFLQNSFCYISFGSIKPIYYFGGFYRSFSPCDLNRVFSWGRTGFSGKKRFFFYISDYLYWLLHI